VRLVFKGRKGDNGRMLSRLILLNFFLQASIATIDPYTQLFLRNKGYSYSLVGIIYAVGQAASIVFPILFCMISDKTRKTKLMFFLMAVGTLGFVVAALNNSLFLTFVCFFVASACLWTLNPMNDGYQNRVFNGDSSKYGVARAMGTMGYVVCLVFFGISGFPDETNNQSIALGMGIALLLFCLSAALVPQDSVHEKVQSPSKKVFSFSWFSSKFYLIMGIVFISRIAESVVDKMLSSYLTENLNLGSHFSLLVALGAASEFVMLIVGGKLLQKGKVKPYTLITLSALALTVRLLIYRFFPTTVACVFAAMLHSFNFGALHIGLSKYIAQNVNEDHYSLAMSLYWAIATNFPEMIGTLIGGFVIDAYGYPTLFASYAILPAIAFVLFIVFRKKLRG
jgi:MFS transporter, PPP family, 3-phenylpropionic acid transporter